MATRGRDLKIAVVSDLDRFDLKDAANEFDKLGDASKDAGREVDRGLKDAERGMDDLGDKADKTRRDLNQFLDKLGDNAKRAGRETRDGLKTAERGMDDLKSEAGQSGREAAASFSGGFDSVTDFMQETAANALSGFGAVGGALGIAAAAGLGFMANKAQEAAERIKDVRESLRDMLRDSDTSRFDRVEHFFEFLSDAGADLPGLQRALREAGVTMDEFVSAAMQGGPALEDVKRRLREVGNEGSGLAGFWDSQVRGAQSAYEMLDQYAQGAAQANEENRIAGPLLEDVSEKQAAYAAKLQEVKDAKYEETLGAIAAGLSSVGDASGAVAEAVAEDGQVSIQAVIDALNEQTEAAKNHAANLRVALEEGGAEFAAWMAGQPAEVAAAYVKGSDKERANLRAAAFQNGEAMGEGTAAGLVSTTPLVQAKAAAVHAQVRRKLEGEPVVVPVTVGSATGVDAVKAAIRARFGTIEIPVVPKQFGQGRYIP